MLINKIVNNNLGADISAAVNGEKLLSSYFLREIEQPQQKDACTEGAILCMQPEVSKLTYFGRQPLSIYLISVGIDNHNLGGK
ncbi:MAG: hypothetical protein AAFQ57_12065 [Cyanobacteria bacterium J06626_14]